MERKSKALILIHGLILFLKERPNCLALYDDVREYLNIGSSFKKLFKHSDFAKFIRGDVRVRSCDFFTS